MRTDFRQKKGETSSVKEGSLRSDQRQSLPLLYAKIYKGKVNRVLTLFLTNLVRTPNWSPSSCNHLKYKERMVGI
jgi:hypothetical protein